MKTAYDATKMKNQMELLLSILILGLCMVISAVVLWKVGSASESHILIPVVASAEKEAKPRSVFSEAAAPEPLDRKTAKTETGPQLNVDVIGKGRVELSEKALLKELEINPSSEDILMKLAMIQILEKNESSLAIPYLESAIRINPGNLVAVEELLRVSLEHQNWEDALRFFESIPASEAQASIHYGKGSTLLSIGRKDEAVDLLKLSVAEDDSKAFTLRDALASAYLSNGSWEEASREFKEIIGGSYSPDEKHLATIKLAESFSGQRKFNQARSILESILEANPEDEYAVATLEEINRIEQKQVGSDSAVHDL